MKINSTRGYIAVNTSPYGQWIQGLIDSGALDPNQVADREKLDNFFFSATRIKAPRVSWYALGYTLGHGMWIE